MFGDCNTYNSNWRDHPNFSWKPHHLNIKNLLKHHNKPQTLNKFANLNKVQEKENFPSQPYQNSKGIHQNEVKMVITLRSGKEVDRPHAS
ncbi:hypothetical protein AAG906_032246 [Vitis piasezkii]